MPYYASSTPVAPQFQNGEAQDWRERLTRDERWEYARRLKRGPAGGPKGQNPRLDPELVPKHFKLSSPKPKRPDVFKTENGALLASDAVVALVERFDSGCHQLIDTTVTTRRGEPLEGGPYRLLHVLALQNTFVPVEGEVMKVEGLDSYQLNLNVHVPALDETQLDPDIHLWKEQRLPHGWFLSDALQAALREQGLRFMKTVATRHVPVSEGMA